jgi:hypothetical protein
MTVKFDPRDWNQALVQLERNAETNEPAAPEEMRQRDEFKVKVIEARVKLKLMRDRTEALRQSLERFRARRESMSA